jgi:hypothetical protein
VVRWPLWVHLWLIQQKGSLNLAATPPIINLSIINPTSSSATWRHHPQFGRCWSHQVRAHGVERKEGKERKVALFIHAGRALVERERDAGEIMWGGRQRF